MASLNAPLSVQELTEQASRYEYNVWIPLRNWLRTASTMQKEVRLPVPSASMLLMRPALYRLTWP